MAGEEEPSSRQFGGGARAAACLLAVAAVACVLYFVVWPRLRHHPAAAPGPAAACTPTSAGAVAVITGNIGDPSTWCTTKPCASRWATMALAKVVFPWPGCPVNQ